MGVPKIRYDSLFAARCAARERPYGPAPTIATSIVLDFTRILRQDLTLNVYAACGFDEVR
jgi:hypothetical protein